MTASIDMPSFSEPSLSNTPTKTAAPLSPASLDVQQITHQQTFDPKTDGDKKKPASITPHTLTKTSGSSDTPGPSRDMDRPFPYELPKCAMPPPSEFASIETFVANAIQSQESPAPGALVDPAHGEGYKGLIMALKRPNDPPMLRKVLIALRTAGRGRVLNQLLLGGNHAELIHLIIRFASTQKPSSFGETASGDGAELLSVYDDNSLCDAHFHLLLAMVSAKSTNVVPVLSAVWKLLTAYGPLNEPQTERMHAMLYNTLRLVPTATSDMFPIIAAKFPFWGRKAEDLVWYATQSMTVLNYVPSMRQKVFELLIDKCLEIDVNIFIKDNGDAIIEEEKDQNNDEEECEGTDSSTMRKLGRDDTVDLLSDKLDALLELLFLHIQAASNNTVAGSRKVFYELLPIFESSILTTHKSKFVQYAIFLSCGLETQARETKRRISEPSGNEMDTSPGGPIQSDDQHGGDEDILHREFASKLLEIIVDPYRATTTRQSCACYLASFISRASFVCAETICESVSALLRWAEAYIGSLDVYSIHAADAREQSERHAVFYTVCQAAFYIMSFRGREAVQFYQIFMSNQKTLVGQEEASPDAEFMNLNMDRWTFLCRHELQPLRFCLESVRSEFLHVAHFFGLIEQKVLDDLVIDAKRLSTGRVNKKAASKILTAATLERRRQNGGVGGLGRGSNPLKSFFPFDPMLLRRSHELIDPLYKHWQGPVEEDDVLVIDDIEGGSTELMFEMDETMEDSEGGLDQEEDDDESEDDEATARHNSEVVSDPETNEEDPIYGSVESTNSMRTPDVYEQRLLQQKAWTETLKRPRSQSLENGSW